MWVRANSVIDPAKWQAEFKEVVTKLHNFATYLFYMGIVYIIGSITVLATKTIQLVRVSQMNSIPKGNNI